jgi:protoporphyrinogen oxidase
LKVVVLGGGPAGLAAAHALTGTGAEVTVVEAAPQLGGLAASHEVGRHRADLGPHRLHEAASPRVRALYAELGALSRRRRRGRLHLGGREITYPLSPWRTPRELGLLRALRFAAGALSAAVRAASPTYAGTVRRRVGAPLYAALYGPAARKVWGRDGDELDGAQAAARVGARSPAAVLSRLFGSGEPGGFLYRATGVNGDIYRAWGAQLASRGADILLGTRAVAVAHDGRVVRSVRLSSGAELPCERVVSTLALPRLTALLTPPIDLGEGELSMRSVIVLYVVVRRRRFSDVDVHYFPDDNVPFARLTEQRAFGVDPGAPDDETVLSLDFYDDAAGPLVRAGAAELLELALPTLRSLGLGRDEIVEIDRVVAPEAYPVMHLGFAETRARALDACAAIAGLLPTGRGGLFLHVNQHDAVEMGLLAGEIAAGSDAAQRWRDAARRFEACVVVD